MRKKLITVITVCYNSQDTIERCIKSVINQDLNDVEYIIIDGESLDNTLDIIKIYASNNSIINYISEKDNGIYDAMNKALNMANGEWIIFINSDDWMEKDLIYNIRDELQNSEFDAIYGNIMKVNQDGELINIEIPSTNINKNIKIGMPIFHQAVFIKRKVYIDLNGFNTDYKIAGDWDFISRMYCRNYKFKYIPIVFSNFTIGGASNQSHIIERHNVRKNNGFYNVIDLLMIKEIIVNIKNKIFK